jgi:hypothetical protein
MFNSDWAMFSRTMRCVVHLLAIAIGLMVFVLGALTSYVFGPAMGVLLQVCLVGWVLLDCWLRLERLAVPMDELKRRLGLRQRVE